MAKTFVRVSLATKFRVLFAAAGLVVVVTALAAPWYFTERMVEDATGRSAGEIARLSLREWAQRHQVTPSPPSDVARYFSSLGDGRRGPIFVPLTTTAKTQSRTPAGRAFDVFRAERQRKMVMLADEGEHDEKVYRCFRAVRARESCLRCHDGVVAQAFQPDQLVGATDMTVPPASGSLIWWTRGMFALGAVLALAVAMVSFYFITGRVVLEPVRRLDELAEKVADGDLRHRCEVASGDEFEGLARRFNEMLDVINAQQDQLRRSNRVLDLRLSELAEANVALYEAGRIKNEFLANVSHELRTPLNSIIGFAELLSETDDEKRRRHAGHILTSARLLEGIINDLLAAARIEAGKGQINIEKTSLTDLCETLGQLVKPIADKKYLKLRVQLAENVPVVMTDAGKVQQILYNLLSNAIKFTPPAGSVVMSARRVDSAISSLHTDSVALAVSDTGPGIPVADQQRIFEKFSRLDNTMTREHGGAGLGLAISKTLAGLLGGRLTLDSEPGHGAIFTLLIPVKAPGYVEGSETR